MKNLNENIGGKIEIEFQDWLDMMYTDKDYPERLTLETVIDYAQDTLRDYDLDDWVPQGQSTSESKKMEDFDLKKYLAEGRLLKEEKTFNVYNDDGEPVLVNLDKATPSQEKLIRWEMPNITEPETSEEAQEIANEIMQLNSVEDVKQYYGDKRGWFNSSLKTLVGDAMVVYSSLAEGKLLKEDDLNEISRDAYDRMESLANENKLNELKDLIMILGEDWANEGFENGDIVDYLETLVYQLVRS